MQDMFDARHARMQYRGRAAGATGIQVADDRLGALLLDRDRQPGDQLRHFVESLGIMILDRPCQAGEAFVVAHRWHIAWDDRRYRTLGLNDRHKHHLQNRTGEANIVPE